jgi:hypothetical protein
MGGPASDSAVLFRTLSVALNEEAFFSFAFSMDSAEVLEVFFS